MHGTAAVGGEVQLAPRDGVTAGPRCQPAQSQPSQHGAESDFDAHHFEASVGGAGEHDVGDTGETLPRDVDHLGIQNVTRQEDFVDSERVLERLNREAVGGVVEHDGVVLSRSDCRRRHQHVGGSATPHQYPFDAPRTSAQAHCQVGKAADQRAVRTEDGAADEPAEKQHSRSMPEHPRLGVDNVGFGSRPLPNTSRHEC